MLQFIKKLFFFAIPLVIAFIGLSLFADGYTDPYYLRFTTPKQKSLIIGTSKAAQGLQPKVFENKLGIKIYNYAFAINQSAFGKVYYESIVKKHKKVKDGIFIITVDPWSICSKGKNPNDSEQFVENESPLAKTQIVNLYPNVEYLYENLKGKYSDLFIPPSDNLFLHDDGWLEIKGISMNKDSLNKRIANKIIKYKKEHLNQSKFSTKRLYYLLKTIKYLQNYGKIYLVRLPVHESMMKLENELMPDFNDKIKEAINISDDYYDMTSYNNYFIYTDGNHLYKDSGEEVSALIANRILNKNKMK